MPVAGHQVAAGLGDADYRLARAQLRRRDPVVHEALEVERSLVDAVGIVEPVARAKPDIISSHSRSLLSSWGSFPSACYTGGVAVEVLPSACISVGRIVSSGT